MSVLWNYRARYVSNHDGDSVVLLVDQGFGNNKLFEDGLRLQDVWAPELSQVGGAATRDFVANWFATRPIGSPGGPWPFVVTTQRNRTGIRERVTFGRYVGVVVCPGDPVSLNDAVNDYVIRMGYPRGTGFPG